MYSTNFVVDLGEWINAARFDIGDTFLNRVQCVSLLLLPLPPHLD
jgi:hypothetical protein